MAKTSEERLQELEEKMKQLKAQKRKIIAREKEQERKARTRRLIQIGAIVEEVLKRPFEGEEDLIRLQTFLYQQEKNGNFFSKAMNPKKTKESTATEKGTDK